MGRNGQGSHQSPRPLEDSQNEEGRLPAVTRDGVQEARVCVQAGQATRERDKRVGVAI